ncbi:MAG: ABC transporter ATP-binding protein [Acidobacteria bacterium]|nr:ABC transporter ATP-binding protein [Acidobacteriota bacterium]
MSPARQLLGYVLRYRRPYLLGFVFVVGATALTLAGPWVLRHAIDELATELTAGRAFRYALLLFGLALAAGVFRFLMRWVLMTASRDIEFDLRNDFFARLQQLDLDYFTRHRTGELMSRATNDLSAVRMLVGPAVMYTASTALTFVVAIGLMLSINPRLTLIALIPLPLVSVAVRGFGAAIHRRFDRIQAQLAEISALAQEEMSGVRVVRAYGQEAFETERFRQANQEYLTRNRALIALQGLFFPSMGLLMGVGALLVLWLGARDVVTGRMTVGELVAFNAYLVMLAWPMIAFGWVTNLLQRGMASWQRMLDVMRAEPGVSDRLVEGPAGAAADGAWTPRGAIEFRHLTFAYDGRTVLDDVSAVLPAGSTTAIVGATGSGKSTLLRMLPRLIDPPEGTVFIDGLDVRHLPLAVLRRAIGFVPQEPFLFGATVGENVAFGVPEADTTGERVMRAAAVARLDADVAAFPRGYDTVVGERGITLSGGQKQRTAIARAVAVDPRILVLDDALSAVDTSTEDEILRRLSDVMRTRTSILVSHRVSTVRHADQILVLQEGRIVERGTHASLLADSGIYAGLHRTQLLEEELAAS